MWSDICLLLSWLLNPACFSSLQIRPFGHAAWLVTPAVAQWPPCGSWGRLRTRQSPLIGWFVQPWFPRWLRDSLQTHADQLPSPNTNLHLYERSRRGDEHAGQILLRFHGAVVKVWVACRIFIFFCTKMDCGGRNSVCLWRSDLKASHRGSSQ